MAVCAHYRVRHSEFVAWDVDDREKAIAWHVRQIETCPSCGTRPAEWDPTMGGSRDAYRAEIIRCRGCVEKQRAEHAPELQSERGLSVVLVRNRDAVSPVSHVFPEVTCGEP